MLEKRVEGGKSLSIASSCIQFPGCTESGEEVSNRPTGDDQ